MEMDREPQQGTMMEEIRQMTLQGEGRLIIQVPEAMA